MPILDHCCRGFYFVISDGLSMKETFQTWTLLTTVLSVQDWAMFYWPDYFCNHVLSAKINITIAQSFFFLDEYLTYRQT
ncbi:GntP family permease [Bacillus sp. PK3-130]